MDSRNRVETKKTEQVSLQFLVFFVSCSFLFLIEYGFHVFISHLTFWQIVGCSVGSGSEVQSKNFAEELIAQERETSGAEQSKAQSLSYPKKSNMSNMSNLIVFNL